MNHSKWATRALIFAFVLHSFFSNMATAQDDAGTVPESLRSLVTEADFDRTQTALAASKAAGLAPDLVAKIAGSPCAVPTTNLVASIYANPAVYGAILNQVNGEFVDPPTAYNMVNPWRSGSGPVAWQTLTGYVASVPVGLDTIGSVVLNQKTTQVGMTVKRGYTELGNFYYDGSLDILLFSKGLGSPAVQVRLGNQIAILNAGTPPD